MRPRSSTTTFLVLAGALSAAPLLAQGSDSCGSAQAIAGTGPHAFDNTNATKDGGPDVLCDAFGQQDIERDVWFSWIAPASESYELSVCGGSTVDTKVAVYDGGCAAAVLACNDDACGLQSRLVWTAVAGNTYLFRVGTYPGASGGTGTFTVMSLAPVLNPDNGHHYLYVQEALGWDAARQAAEALSFDGVQGHLATISDQAENDWIQANFAGGLHYVWLGGYQDLADMSYSEPLGGWKWITGEPWSFTNWGAGEPNDALSGEHWLQFFFDESWNDAIQFPNPNNGFLVEFETSGLGERFCTATPNSTGEAAAIDAEGSASIADDDLVLSAEPVPNQPFLFFHGALQVQISFGNGFLCTSGGIVRLGPPMPASGNRAVRIVDVASAGIAVGTRHFQCWFRDPAGGGSFFNLSDGMSIDFVP